MVSTSGSRLLVKAAEKALAGELIPLAALITPNLHEAAVLLDMEPAQNENEMRRQAERLLALGPKAVLIKGGHLSGPEAADLFYDGSHFRSYSAPRIAAKNTHGTGCTLSSAIAAFLVKGLPMEEAIAEAKAYLQGAIEQSDRLHIGSGTGPLWHFYRQTPPA
jgi:hydroxymethylpyrimidine/phosphomethylpyrimidine kinase